MPAVVFADAVDGQCWLYLVDRARNDSPQTDNVIYDIERS